MPSLRTCKPAYSEPVTEPGNRKVVAGMASGIKILWVHGRAVLDHDCDQS